MTYDYHMKNHSYKRQTVEYSYKDSNLNRS